MNHREDMDFLIFQFIDQAIAVEKTFADLRIAQLRHDPADFWILSQGFSQLEKAFSHLLGMVKRISANVFGNAINIV